MSLKISLSDDTTEVMKPDPTRFPALKIEETSPEINLGILDKENEFAQMGANAHNHTNQWNKVQDSYGLANVKDKGPPKPIGGFAKLKRDLASLFSGNSNDVGVKGLLNLIVLLALPLYLVSVYVFSEDPLGVRPYIDDVVIELQSSLGFLGLSPGNPYEDNFVEIEGNTATIPPSETKSAIRSAEADSKSAARNNLQSVNATAKLENPYWSLPNDLDAEVPEMNRQWSDAEEVALRNALNHEFNFQRYKAVLEVAKFRLKGSEAILYSALEQKKLWIRMRAAMGLADFGIRLSNNDIDQALVNEPQERIANYFKRFIDKNTVGERYIMRSAIRFVGDKGRLYILKALNENFTEIDRIYIVAAAFDPAPRVQKWLKTSGVLERFSTDEFERLKNEVTTFAEAGSSDSESDSSTISPEEIELLEEDPSTTRDAAGNAVNTEGAIDVLETGEDYEDGYENADYFE